MNKYNEAKTLWNAMTCIMEEQEEDSLNIDLMNLLLEKIESLLPFEDESEHNEWLDISATYKFFEDFEVATMKIMKRLGKS